VVLDVRDAHPGHAEGQQVDVAELSRTGAPLVLPPEVARVADNYNHLHEQPTLFYALALAAQLAGAADAVSVGLAWAYVALRVVHSLIQATVNVIPLRFADGALAEHLRGRAVSGVAVAVRPGA
jgi:hypothetical protein